jgi:ethanolamine permease
MNKPHKLTHYDNVKQQFLDKWQLKPSAGWILLWAMGVGAIISVDFFGGYHGLANSCPPGGIVSLFFGH